MEAGRITWADEDNIQDLRHLYRQRFVRSTPSAQSHAAPNMTKGPLFCLSFQNDKCPFNGDHNTTRGRVRHICAYCLLVSRVNSLYNRLYSRSTRRSVMAVAREKLAETGVRIIDDLTPRDMEAKKRVIPLMNKLYSDKQKPRFVNGKLYSNGKLVPQETIDAFLSQLPGK